MCVWSLKKWVFLGPGLENSKSAKIPIISPGKNWPINAVAIFNLIEFFAEGWQRGGETSV